MKEPYEMLQLNVLNVIGDGSAAVETSTDHDNSYVDPDDME